MTSPDSQRNGAETQEVDELTLPDTDAGYDQDEEWCEVTIAGEKRKIRFHDYHEIYSIPGLYEQIFYEVLECQSPKVVRGLFERELEEEGFDANSLRVLDLGAGNGMVGEELAELGASTQVGADIIPEAKMAAERDRPGVYADYHVADFTALDPELERQIRDAKLNTMICVAALGFGDIPPAAFAQACNLIKTPGWVAFNIKDEFVDEGDKSGFQQLIDRAFEEGVLRELTREHYQHRLSVAGEPLHYVAFVAEKTADIPAEWLREAEEAGVA